MLDGQSAAHLSCKPLVSCWEAHAGARLAEAQGIPVSSDTLLRLVRATDVPERSTPEVLGVDDFALRKGVKYGTILLNLERQCLVDLLPDREKATVATWLKSHPGVKMVSRDRGGAYAEAAREAAPDAIQIADRFHLSQNAGEMVVRIMRRNYDRVKELVDETPQSAQPLDQSLPFQRHEADKQVSQQRRMAVYEHVILLYEQGCSPTEIAAQLRMSRKRVREFLRVTTFSTCIQATFNQARSIQSVSQAARGSRMGVAIPYSSIVKCVVKATMDVVR